MEAEVRALRAQISPHFIYNSLTTIASFVRSDPNRSRELLLEFADFTRYSFRRHGEFTTLAEELRSIDRYLTLERARFGDQLQVTLRIAPEVLAVAVPFLCLQPLVENAVQHGLESKLGVGRISIIAEDAGAECRISVEDDGVGMEPERLRRILVATPTSVRGPGEWGWSTWTSDSVRCTETSTAWWPRPVRARARRSASACRSTIPASPPADVAPYRSSR
ncbi:sensor histidine kinase [Streptosporangium lutulentum]